MGMYDTIRGADGRTWQTKAYGCNLSYYDIGDRLLPTIPDLRAYQVQCLGEEPRRNFIDGFATVRDDVLVAVSETRDESLTLVSYSGHIVQLPCGHRGNPWCDEIEPHCNLAGCVTGCPSCRAELATEDRSAW